MDTAIRKDREAREETYQPGWYPFEGGEWYFWDGSQWHDEEWEEWQGRNRPKEPAVPEPRKPPEPPKPPLPKPLSKPEAKKRPVEGAATPGPSRPVRREAEPPKKAEASASRPVPKEWTVYPRDGDLVCGRCGRGIASR